MRELKDRLRYHLDEAAPPVDVDRLVEYLAVHERTDDMPVALEPERTTDRSAGRRPRVGLVFAAAVVATILAVGLAGLVFGGGDTTGEPGDIPVTVAPNVTDPLEGEPGPDVTPPPVTIQEPVTTALVPPQARIVQIDTNVDLDWAQPSIALDADGTPMVIYQRNEATIAHAACDGPECAAPTVAVVHEAVGGVGWLIGTPRAGHGPVFWVQQWPGNTPNEQIIRSALVMCEDTRCADPEVIALRESEHGAGLPSISVTPDGAPMVMWSEMAEPSGVVVTLCSDPTCSGDVNRHRVWTEAPGQWIDGGSIAVGGGRPVVAFRGSSAVFIGTCRNDDCDPMEEESGLENVVEVPLPGAPLRDPAMELRSDGSPTVVVLVENGIAEDVVAVACDSPACDDPQVTVLGTVLDTWAEWDAALGDDDRLRVAWTEDGVLHVATCGDAMCSSSDVVELSHPARDVAIVVNADGHPILATSNPDRGLELVICADRGCALGP